MLKVLTPRLWMDEWANSLKELEMLLPATSGGSVTVCALSQRMCRLFVERTRQNILGTYLLFTQPQTALALAVVTMVVERERHAYEERKVVEIIGYCALLDPF